MGWEHLAPSLDYLLLQCAYRNQVQEFDGEIGREMGMAAPGAFGFVCFPRSSLLISSHQSIRQLNARRAGRSITKEGRVAGQRGGSEGPRDARLKHRNHCGEAAGGILFSQKGTIAIASARSKKLEADTFLQLAPAIVPGRKLKKGQQLTIEGNLILRDPVERIDISR